MALGFDYSSSGPRLDDQAREVLRARAEEIVRSFLGEPNRSLSNKRELRWGRRGSFALVVEGANLAEGSTVTVLLREDDEAVDLTPEEEAELLESISEIERGEFASGEDLLERLRRFE